MIPCIVVSEKNINKAIDIIHQHELCEIRLDLCRFNDEEIKKIFSQGRNLIATYHPNDLEISIRINSLKLAIESGATYVDIDYFFEPKDIESLVKIANSNSCKSIISYHNFEETPDYQILEAIVILTQHYNSDLVKIATKYNTKNDSDNIFALYEYSDDLIAFCIGDEAKYTRLESLKRGAPFCYVYDGKDKNKVADGQLSLEEFNLLFKN